MEVVVVNSRTFIFVPAKLRCFVRRRFGRKVKNIAIRTKPEKHGAEGIASKLLFLLFDVIRTSVTFWQL